MKHNLIETLMGALVLAIAVGFMIFVYDATGMRAAGGYEVVARFDRVDAWRAAPTSRCRASRSAPSSNSAWIPNVSLPWSG